MKYSFCIMVFEGGDKKHQEVQAILKEIDHSLYTDKIFFGGQAIADSKEDVLMQMKESMIDKILKTITPKK